jgi:hypothetical protein
LFALVRSALGRGLRIALGKLGRGLRIALGKSGRGLRIALGKSGRGLRVAAIVSLAALCVIVEVGDSCGHSLLFG